MGEPGRVRGRVAALDGLRGVAVLSVVAVHAGVRGTGSAGVTVFFTLSGYLITGILLRQHERTGSIDWRAFYRRRAARLFPALAVLLAFVLAWWGREATQTVIVTALYLANLVQSSDSLWLFGPLHHMWSLSVEEQFYLVWPWALLALLRSRARLVRWLAAATAIGLVIRLVGIPLISARWAGHATLPMAFALLAGATLAAGAFRTDRRAAWVGTVLLAVAVLQPAPHPVLTYLDGPLACAAACLLIVSQPRWLEVRWLRYCGTVSYGWYLWHVPAQLLLGGLVGSVVSFGVAVVSWHLMEKPIIRRWSVSRRVVHADAGVREGRVDGPLVGVDVDEVGGGAVAGEVPAAG